MPKSEGPNGDGAPGAKTGDQPRRGSGNIQRSSNQDTHERKYDLEERTARFGEATIEFAKRIPVNPITQPLIPQLVRAATSIGANYGEADDAGTKRSSCTESASASASRRNQSTGCE